MIAVRKEQLKFGCCDKGRFESRCYVASVIFLIVIIVLIILLSNQRYDTVRYTTDY